MTVTRGEGREIMGKKGEGSSGNMYRGHMDKAKGGRIESGRWGWLGVRSGGEKIETSVLEQQ